MALQNLPPSYRAYHREQQRVTRGAVAEVRRQWRTMGDDFDTSWRSVGPAVLAITGPTQHQMTELAGEFIPDFLDEVSARPPPAAVGRVNPAAMVGVAGDGRTAEGLLYGAVTRTKSAVGSGLSVREAQAAGLAWITMATTTLLGDTARGAEVVGMATRTSLSYVRVVQSGACSRCAILAGQTYGSKDAFLRHPGCLCEHMPIGDTSDRQALEDNGWAVSPEDYFDSLPEAEQDRIFTNAGAEAIRNGADPAQVVNARRGMTRAQSRRPARDSQGLYTTTEGTTRYGMYRRRGGTGTRLMPESIVEIAGGNPARMQELLRQYAYII